MRSGMSVQLEKNSLWPADPSLAHFLEQPTTACPRSAIHAGQKCPQFCGIGKSWILNELCLEPVPPKEYKGERSGEHGG